MPPELAAPAARTIVDSSAYPDISTARVRSLMAAGELDAIRSLRRTLVREMLNGGENAESVSRAVSLLNRRLICCVLEHFARQHIWLKRCTFLEFGSGGRDEQIPGSDQDNGLLWTGDDPDPHDLEEAAQSVVVTLDGAGLPLCPGGVMFNSEKWRGNFTTWSDRLTSWLANPREKGPWQFGLILDFTPVFGPQEQALALREELWKYIRSRPLAIKILTSELMAYRLPLTFWGSFVLEKKGPCAGLLNIKSPSWRI